jgi:hypothetical protein
VSNGSDGIAEFIWHVLFAAMKLIDLQTVIRVQSSIHTGQLGKETSTTVLPNNTLFLSLFTIKSSHDAINRSLLTRQM